MIYGAVLESRDLDPLEDEGWEFTMFSVKIPDMPPAGKNSIWVSVYSTASVNGLEFGTFCIPFVKHHLTNPRKSALNRVDETLMRDMAFREATDTMLFTLTELNEELFDSDDES